MCSHSTLVQAGPRPAPYAQFIAQLAGLAHRVSGTVETWRARAEQRRALRNLGDRLLKDIGLSRADVRAEACRPFWRE